MRSASVVLVLCAACSAGKPTSVDASAAPHDSGARDARARDGRADVDAARAPRDAGGDALSCHPDLLGCWLQQPCAGCCVDLRCVPAGASCGPDAGTCVGTSCAGAGSLGEPCATVPAPTWVPVPDASTLVCAYQPWTGCTDTAAACGEGGACVHCGLTGEACCGGYCTGRASCFQGVCTTACGAIGQLCCAGDAGYLAGVCDDGGVCLDVAVGRACVPSAVCDVDDAGACTNCGNAGQSCCGDGGCNLSLVCDGYRTCVSTMR